MKGGYESARDLDRPLSLSADVVVVGSGAGGAIVATELAQSGQSVVVLEEGPNVLPEVHARMRPTESVRHVWRDGAMTVALGIGNTPAINVMMGRCVGGSSTLTGGVCFRIPDFVLKHWTEELGLSDYDSRSMEPYFEHVERAIHVETVPVEMRSRSTELFAEGAARRGFAVKSMQRNTEDCKGRALCNFGCPEGAKKSVDISYLPRAVAAGTTVYSHCLVEGVMTKNGRAVAVRGRILNRAGGKAGHKLTVHAKRVVLCAGAWHTPSILRRSGIGTRAVGHNLTLHPGLRVMARFKESVKGWQGALQGAFSDAFEGEGITLTSMFVPPGVLAATMPGVGAEHTENAEQVGRLAVFGGMIHDEPSGTVRRGLGREPIVTYRMSKRDRAKVSRLIRIMADTYFAAGAEKVFFPVLGEAPLSADEATRFPLEEVSARRFECTSQHPLGSCQMGKDERDSAVDSNGKVWGVDELYIADGSIMPTSLGVNPQLAIMAAATRIAWHMRDKPLGS